MLRRIQAEKYKDFAEKNLEQLLSLPTLGFLEASIENLELEVGISSKTNILWLGAILFTMTIIPALILGYICVTLLVSPVYGIFLTLISVILTALLTIRSISVLIKTWKL